MDKTFACGFLVSLIAFSAPDSRADFPGQVLQQIKNYQATSAKQDAQTTLLTQIKNNQTLSSVAATITTTASITTVSVKVLNENLNRKGLIIYNNSSNSVYIAFDVAVNSGNHMTAIIPTFAQWIAPVPCYTGAIAAIRNAGSGALMITETF